MYIVQVNILAYCNVQCKYSRRTQELGGYDGPSMTNEDYTEILKLIPRTTSIWKAAEATPFTLVILHQLEHIVPLHVLYNRFTT